jgi:hypothetical protein
MQNTVQMIENTVNKSPHITKTPTQLSKQPQYKIQTKLNGHISITCLLHKFTLMYTVIFPQEIDPKSFHFISKQNHFTQITSVHSTSLHLLTLNQHFIPLDCNYILNPPSKRVQFTGERR